MKKLFVYLHNCYTGTLQEEKQGCSFRYCNSEASSLSPKLLNKGKTYSGQEVESFFSGLLPDGDIRCHLASVLKYSEDNYFALLGAIGGECAGAISLFKEKKEASFFSEQNYKPLTNEEAYALLNSLDDNPMNVEGINNNIRMSGAGAQNKLVFKVLENNQLALPLGNSPSSHIIKPEITRKKSSYSVENEYFCMLLAKRCGFNIPEVKIHLIKGKRFYCIQRYDRTVEAGQINRLQQLDFCQLLNIEPERKYQNEGGPSLLNCFKVINENSIQAAKDKKQLLLMVLFNYFIGNGDAHGKNFSLLEVKKDDNIYWQLAPFYDLLCTQYYGDLKLAMKIGNTYRFKKVKLNKFISFAEENSIKTSYLKQEMSKLKSIILDHSKKLVEELNTTFPCSIYEKIAQTINYNCHHL